jgi:hypothetical protein
LTRPLVENGLSRSEQVIGGATDCREEAVRVRGVKSAILDGRRTERGN